MLVTCQCLGTLVRGRVDDPRRDTRLGFCTALLYRYRCLEHEGLPVLHLGYGIAFNAISI